MWNDKKNQKKTKKKPKKKNVDCRLPRLKYFKLGKGTYLFRLFTLPYSTLVFARGHDRTLFFQAEEIS